jgi:arylformamidase
VREESPALKLGFKNFPMDRFGVKKPSLKAIARTPVIPPMKAEKKKRPPATGEWLGARLQDLEGEAFSAYGIAKDEGGVAVIEVPEGSAAARAGLKTDDLLLQINGHRVSRVGHVRRFAAQSGAGPLTLKIVRDQTPMTLTLVVAGEGAQSPDASRAASKKAEVADIPPTHADVPYDVHERTKLDFWQAEGDGPRPLRVHIHWGGWILGDKKQGAKGVENDLKKGISVASINHRFSTTDPLPTPVLDAVRAIQFLRHKAKEWNIDKNRIVLTGRSAGGCTALLIACMDDLADPASDDPVKRESSRIQGAAVFDAQTSIDPQVIEPWIGTNVWHEMIFRAVGEGTVEDAKANYEKHKDLYRQFSPYNHLSKDDPPLFLRYNENSPVPATSLNLAIHHAMFGIKLKEKSKEVGHNSVQLVIGKPRGTTSQDQFVESILLGK